MTDKHHTYTAFVPDASQQAVLQAGNGCHLVLAPPGCGKTQLLTERVVKAAAEGTDTEQMLCLTFTNRAARNMQKRIEQQAPALMKQPPYVGNIHRFCARMLYQWEVLAPETDIIDEEDALSIMAQTMDVDETTVKSNSKWRRTATRIIRFAQMMAQIRRNQPRDIRLNTDSLYPDDITAMNAICKAEGTTFDRQKMMHIYEHTELYRNDLNNGAYPQALHYHMENMLTLMEKAHFYEQYKRQHALVDFQDLLVITYTFLKNAAPEERPHYRWIQVDEVQDLNALQFAIIDLLADMDACGQMPSDTSIMYLGDYQQAIFSFMGAKLDMLATLAQRCRGHVYHLGVNHRSPGYMLDLLNDFARLQLNVAAELLPRADNQTAAADDHLRIDGTPSRARLLQHTADLLRPIAQEGRHDTAAVIVTSNVEADDVSATLTAQGIDHFKISGTDIFTTDEMKLLCAHLAVTRHPVNFMAWARILKGMGVYRTEHAARHFVHEMLQRGMTPADLLTENEDSPTAVQQFKAAWETREVVIFDTETTGLDVTEDDIVQIAAVKVRNGHIVPGSQLSLHLATDRPIPEMLGDVVNPIIEARQKAEIIAPDVALARFMDYAAGCTLMGHNAAYDYHILHYCLQRHLPHRHLHSEHPEYTDTLLLAKLLLPRQTNYKLKTLLQSLGLEGQNTHLADDDIMATLSLAVHLYGQACHYEPLQAAWKAQPENIRRSGKLRRDYAPLYRHTLAAMHTKDTDRQEPALVREMKYTYQTMTKAGIMQPIARMDTVMQYIAKEMVAPEADSTLAQQADRHATELNTLREADLCNSSVLKERIYVTTVHKAKGLEFDTVIVHDAVDGRYPNFFSQRSKERLMEDTRLLYVAMSRARRSLIVTYAHRAENPDGTYITRTRTPLLNPVLNHFRQREL